MLASDLGVTRAEPAGLDVAQELGPRVLGVARHDGVGLYTLDAVRRLRWDVPADKPLLFSEFGADALAGLHDPTAQRKFSEEYQAAYYRATLAMAARISVQGMSWPSVAR